MSRLAKKRARIAQARFSASTGQTVAFAAAVALPGTEPEYVERDGVRYVAGRDQQIFPRGRSRAIDGREVILDDRNGPAMVADFARRSADLAITFDHENDRARGSAAAGWASALEWREDGLWATGVLWTIPAYQEIAAGTWRYISGDAFAEGDLEKGEPAYPICMKAFSLVPIPALQNGLQPIALSAATLEGLQPTAPTTIGKETKKGNKMDEATMAAVLKALGCTADSTPEEIEAAAAKFTAAAHPEPDGDEVVALIEPPGPEEEKPPAFVKTGAQKKMTEPNAAGIVSAALAASEKRMRAQFAADVESVRLTMKAEAESNAKKERINTVLLSAIKDGKITAGERDRWAKRLEFDLDGETAAIESIKPHSNAPTQPISAKFAAAQKITGGDGSMPDWSRMENEERTYWLNRTLTLSAAKNLPIRDSLAAVLRGEGEEDFEAIESARRNGTKYRGCGFRQKSVTLSADFDWDKVKYARERLKEGNGTGTAVSDEFRHRVNVRFATVAGLQPGAMTTIPATIGYAEGDYAAPEILEEYVGGATLNANVFSFGQERFYIKVDVNGNPIATAPTGDPNRTDFDVTPSTITLKAYSDQILVDRMLQDAAVALPEGLMGIAGKHIQSMVKVRREVAAANFLRTYTNFNSANYDTLSGTRQWDQDTGLPITDVTNAMLVIDGVVGQMPDVSVCSPKCFTGMRRNKQIVEYVKFTGTMGAPGTMVPIETMVALFGMKFIVANARHTTVPGGTPAYTWGQDFVMAVTGKGEISAPRFGYTVVAAGYPLTQTFPMNFNGPAGSDAIQVADAFAIKAGLNTAGYLFLTATNLS